MPLPDAWLLMLVALVALLLGGALAPLEALGWWAGWFGPPRDPPEEPAAATGEAADAPQPEQFVVFLSGIHTVSGETFSPREQGFLQQLRARLPRAAVLEVFPYSVTNRALTGQRVFAWFWRWALRMKLSKATLAGIAGTVINLRNVWQVAVSADRRYGPIYNQGSADQILAALRRAGCRRPPERPVVLIGYSGGGQIALGAAAHLQEALGGPVTVVSLGGVMSADPALQQLERLYHLHGRNDLIHRAGNAFFPGRWPLLPYSPWNQARKRGVIRLVDMGPPDHTGRKGYLDATQRLPDGRSYQQQTVEVIAAIVEGGDPVEATYLHRAAAGGTGGAPTLAGD